MKAARRARISGRLGAAAKALPVGAGYGWAGWGQRWPNAAQYDFGRHDLAGNSVVAVALAWIRRNIVKGRIVAGNEEADGTYEEVPGHPLIAMLRRPNPLYSWRATLGATSDCLCIDGNAYWIKARALGSVAEVYWVPNHCIAIEPETDRAAQERSGPVRAYRYTAGSFRRDYLPSEVIHFRDGIDPWDMTRGISDLKRQLRNAASIDFAERYTSAVLRNAHAGKLLAPKDAGSYVSDGSPDEAEMLSVAGRIEAGAQGENVGRIAKSTIPLDLIDLGMGPEDMSLDRIHHWPAAMILASLGLNPLALNLPGGDAVSTFANKAEARAEAHTAGVNPRRDLIADEVEHQLLPDFPDPEADSVYWDLRDVDDLQEDADKRAGRAVSLQGIATLNERRSIVDLPPVEGGDVTPAEEAERAAEIAERIAGGDDEGDEYGDEPPGEEDDDDLAVKARRPGKKRRRKGGGTGARRPHDESKHPRGEGGRFRDAAGAGDDAPRRPRREESPEYRERLADHAAEARELARDIRAERRALPKEHAAERRALLKEHAAEARELPREQAAEVREVARDQAREAKELARDQAREVRDLREDHAEEGRDYRREDLAEARGLREEHRRGPAAGETPEGFAARRRGERADLADQIRGRRQDLAAEHAKARSDQAQDHEEARATLDADHAGVREAHAADHAGARADLLERHRSELADQAQEHRDAIAAQREDHLATARDLTERHRSELADVRREELEARREEREEGRGEDGEDEG